MQLFLQVRQMREEVTALGAGASVATGASVACFQTDDDDDDAPEPHNKDGAPEENLRSHDVD